MPEDQKLASVDPVQQSLMEQALASREGTTAPAAPAPEGGSAQQVDPAAPASVVPGTVPDIAPVLRQSDGMSQVKETETGNFWGQPEKAADGTAAPETGNQQAAAASASAPIVPPVTEPPAPIVPDWNELTGGKFKSWEDIQAELGKQVTPEPPKFPNELSKQVYDALLAGNIEPVREYLVQVDTASKVSTLTDEEAVKRIISKQYPSLDKEEVQWEYDSRYLPDETGLNDRQIQMKKKMASDKLKADAAEARAELGKMPEPLNLPSFQAPAPAAAGQSAQEPPLTAEEKALLELGQTYVYKEISKVPFEFEASDKSVKYNGEVSIPSAQVQEISQKIAIHPEAFIAGFLKSRWGSPDGEMDPNKIAHDIWLLSNPNYLTSQAVGEAHKTFLVNKLQQERNMKPNGITPGGAFQPTEQQANDAALDKLFRIPAPKNGSPV